MSLPVAIKGKAYFGILARRKKKQHNKTKNQNNNNNNSKIRKFVMTFS